MARSFNGTTDKINCGHGSSLNPMRNFTIAGWGNSTGTSDDFILARDDGGAQRKFAFGKVSNKLYMDSGNGVPFSGVGPTISINTWYHYCSVVVSNTGNPGIAYGFLNGTFVATGSMGAIISATSTDLLIGNRGDGAVPFGGNIAHVAMWSTNISAGEVVLLASGVRPNSIQPLSLVGYWPLFGIPSPEPDLSQFGNNGTLTGTGFAADPPQMRSGSPTDILWVPPEGEMPALLLPAPSFISGWSRQSNLPVIGGGTF